MPVTSALLDQAHNAIERKLLAMQGFHHPHGSQQAFLTGLAHLYNLIPLNVEPIMQGKVAWKWKAGNCPPQTECSTCKSSLQEAISVRLHLPTTQSGGM